MSEWTALRHAARTLARAPALTCALLATIALGIGSNVVVDGFIRGLTTSHQPAEIRAAMSQVAFLLRLAAGSVFVMACVNVASFLMARASARSSETSLRLALGARRRQLIQQSLVESGLIAIAGGALGLLCALWTADVVPAWFFEPDAAQLLFVPHRRGMAFVAAICATLVIGCGLAPLLEVRHDNPGAVFQRNGAGASRSYRRLRSALVITQMACCCLLAISAGVLLKSFRGALQTSLGERIGDPILLTVQALPRTTRQEFAAEGARYFQEVERAAKSIRGVSATAWVSRPLGSRPVMRDVIVEPANLRFDDVLLDVAVFTPRSLSSMVLPPLAGRMFGGQDTPQSCPVAIVNDAAARGPFKGRAVGRAITNSGGERVEIVGVVATRPTKGDGAERPIIYYYGEQTGPTSVAPGPAHFSIPRWAQTSSATIDTQIVSPNYFGFLDLPQVAGEAFSETAAPRGCRVGVIDQIAADQYFGGKPVGGAIIDANGGRTTIIGVVQPTRLRHWQRQPEPSLYLSVLQAFVPRMTLLLGGQRIPRDALSEVHEQVAAIEGGTGDITVTTLSQHLGRTALAPERIATVLITAAAGMAFVLAVLGAYGVTAESVRLRRREIALRAALGAQRWRVLLQVVAEACRLGAVATATGVVAALLATPWLTPATSADNSESLWPWISGPLTLFLVVVISSVFPARSALQVDLLTTMREE